MAKKRKTCKKRIKKRYKEIKKYLLKTKLIYSFILVFTLFLILIVFLSVFIFNLINLIEANEKYLYQKNSSQEKQDSFENIEIDKNIKSEAINDEDKVENDERGFLEKVFNLSQTQDKETDTVKQRQEFETDEEVLKVYNFGDNFSNLAYVNKEETNLYWDEIITSLSFVPDYNFEKIGSCQNNSCFDIDENINKECIGSNCLEIKDLDLYFNNRKIDLPSDLKKQDLYKLSIIKLDSKWLVGAIIGQDYDKEVFVYEYDGYNFKEIITDDSHKQMKIKYKGKRGHLSFGGSDDDYIILYSGYEGLAYHNKNNNLSDISKFFGLRVTSSLFIPEIIKLNQGEETTWYICSLGDSHPRLIKLWQNNERKIQGAIDLSDEIFTETLRRKDAYCQASKNNEHSLDLIIDNDLYRFTDYGFIQNNNYQLISKNIVSGNEIKPFSANLISIGLAQEGETLDLYLSNDAKNWRMSKPARPVFFKEYYQALYWKIEFNNNDNNKYYSPWLDHVNKLVYTYKSQK